MTQDVRALQIFTPEAVNIDWLLRSDGTLDDTDALATAVVIALGTDRLAQDTDILPDLDSDDRRGWWGDFEAEEIWNGWPLGSRLWLLARAKITGTGTFNGSTLAIAEAYVREALQPFVDAQIASRLEVVATRTALERIDVEATLYRGPSASITLRYSDLWSDIGVS